MPPRSETSNWTVSSWPSGTASAGVQRQYSGTAGRTENCQIGVLAAYSSVRGRALVDRELYLPKPWTEDRERCRTAGVPDEREFATKGALARHMALRALASSLPISWITADSAYGQDNRLRRLLEQSGVGYVLAVPKSHFSVGCSAIEVLFAQAPDEAWDGISCGDGAKGPRVYHWTAVRLPAVAEFDYQGEVPHRMCWALARRSISKPDEIAYTSPTHPFTSPSGSRCGSPGHAGRSRSASRPRERVRPGPVRGPPLHRLVPAHHSGHARPRLPGRHGTPVLGRGGGTGGTAGVIGLTVAEVRRLLAACRARPPHLSGHRGRRHALRWSNWRRRRQAVARRCHYLRRCRTIEGRSP